MTDNILNRIKVEIKRTYYTHDRYKSLSTFALLYHEKKLGVEQLATYVRISDKLIKIDDNHYFINFAFTSQEDAFKAAQNLLLYLDNFFNSRTSCIAIDTLNSKNTTQMVVGKLTQILNETKKSSYSRIEYEDILNGLI